MASGFREIEHKFVVGDGFDREGFRRRVRALDPRRTTELTVRDVYYLTRHPPGFIYRHRYDRELQHLSVKSLEADSEVRTEVNLDLGQHRGDQQAAVEAFLATLDVAWRGVVEKDIEVFYFPDCEIVYYRAAADGEAVCCVELEAVGATSVDEALAVLAAYEERIAFADRERTTKPVVELLYPRLADRLRPSGRQTMNDEPTFTVLLAKQDFKFSCAHFLVFDAERAELLHGHNYQVRVELAGRSLDDEGLMVDLARLKSRIRRACARLDSRTLVPGRSRQLAVDRRDGGVAVRFRDRGYRFPEGDVLVLDEINISIEVLARMLWRELSEGLDEPRVEQLAVGVSQTEGQECWYRAAVPSSASGPADDPVAADGALRPPAS